MAAEIIPIQLSLTAGDGVTLFAPRWVEDGEEWEAFLGHGDALYLLPDAAHLAAFIRTADEHDLIDHPAWQAARDALADELEPDEDHHFDIVGMPELVAGAADVWTLAELADTVAILHSLAEVCDLSVVDEVLESSAGFAAAAEGPNAFIGRGGRKLWNEVRSVVAEKWDAVVDALDGLVEAPAVDAGALAAAQAELQVVSSREGSGDGSADGSTGRAGSGPDGGYDAVSGNATDAEAAADRDPDLEFWDEVGIDCLSITCGGRTGWTLRCYLDDTPVFLTDGGTVQLFGSPAKLEEYLADPTADNALSHLDAWTTIREAIDGGEASVLAGPENTYDLDGLDGDLLDGPESVDGQQLSLAVELLTDAAAARGDTEVTEALSSASPLGNLIRAATRPDPGRMPPSPPFDDEVAAWRALVDSLAATLNWR